MRLLTWLFAGIVVVTLWSFFSMLSHEPPEIVRPGIPEDMPEAEEIAFANGDLALAGQWFEPEGARAALVIIHGSGTSSRQNAWYASFTRHMVEAGHAVLLPDKRGSEKSGGDWRDASMEDLAADTAAAVAWVRSRRPDLPVGLIGVSQGGWIAAVAAGRDPTLAFAASLSAAAVPPAEQLVLEERNTMRDEMGVPAPVARALAPLTAWNIRRNVQPELWATLEDFDATAHWARTGIPVFIAYGRLDELDNVPVAASAARIEALGKPNIELRVYSGVGHGFFAYETGKFSRDFLSDLDAFIARATGR